MTNKFKIGDKVEIEGYGIGEVLYVKDLYLVGIKGYDGDCGGNLLTIKQKENYILEKGYAAQCEWFYEESLKLIKGGREMNKYIKLFMEDSGLEVNEEFDIIGRPYNPFHFDEAGDLIDKDGNYAHNFVYGVIGGFNEIRRAKLTTREIQKLKSYQKGGFITIAEVLEDNEENE